MQAIKPYTQIYADLDAQDVLGKIEVVARTCYKSEDKIKEGSAEKMVAALIKRGHEAMLEHASFIFKVSEKFYDDTKNQIQTIEDYAGVKSFLRFSNINMPIISGNIRAWRDFLYNVYLIKETLPSLFESFIKTNPVLFPELQEVRFHKPIVDGEFKQIKPSNLKDNLEKLIHQDVTVKFVVDRGISHELVRHRVASFAQESTRYCNYSKDTFNSEITCIIPNCLDYKSAGWNTWVEAMKASENAYFKLLDIGLTPQEARSVLPNSLKTEVVMTANLMEWKHFFNLRAAGTTGKPHPQMLEVTRPLLDDFKKLIPGIFDDIGGDVNGKSKKES